MPLFTYALMGSLTIVSMVITWFIPETRNKVMAETVHEQTKTDDVVNDHQKPSYGSQIQENIPGEKGLGDHKGGVYLSLEKLPYSTDSLKGITPLFYGSLYPSYHSEDGLSNQGYTGAPYVTH